MKSKFLPCFLVLLFLQLFKPANAFADLRSEPVPRAPFIITSGLYNTDIFTGSSNYSYPIKVPKGTNDLTPEVSISYNSLSANGLSSYSGMGWETNRTYIERDVNYTPANTADDKFFLHFQGQHQELVYVSGEERYHTKIESNLYITKLTSGESNDYNEYWQVIAKDGTKYRFGQSTNSEQVCNGRSYVYRWNLDLVTDTHDNNIYYNYSENSGVSYLSEIEYNTDQSRVIEFVYTSNFSPRQLYIQGCNITESQVLSNIKTNKSNTSSGDVLEDKAGSNDLTSSGATEWSSDFPFSGSSKAVRAVSSSSQYLYAPDSASLSMTGSMTAEAWVKFDSLPTTGQEMFILSKYRDDNNQISWTFALQNNSGTYRFRAGTSTNGSNFEAVTSNWTPSTGTWYHVAMVYDSNVPNVKFYVDGSQQGSTQSKSYSSIFDSTTALQIGTINHGGSPSQYLNGKIDEVRIWNVARTANQIDDYKYQELEGNESGLVAYYPFEDLGISPLVRQYDLSYDTASNSGMLLQSITELGSDGTSALPETNFTYKEEIGKWATQSAIWINNQPVDAHLAQSNIALIDMNGDALSDIVKTDHHGGDNVSWKVLLNQGSSWATSWTYWVNNEDIDDARLDEADTRLVDVTGDGLPDIVNTTEPSAGWATWKVFRNTGSSFNTTPETWVNNANIDADLTDADVRVIDVNGDNLSDIIKTVDHGLGNVSWKVFKNTGTSWNTSVETWVNNTWMNGVHSNRSDVALVDVNGDSLPDIIHTSYSGNHTSSSDTWNVYKNTGSSWNTSPETWINNAAVSAHLDSSTVVISDANGDGLIDIVKSVDGGSSDTWKVLLNKGDSWSTTWFNWINPADNVDVDAASHYVRLADVNGDGLPDLVYSTDSANYDTWRVWENKGKATSLLSEITTPQGGSVNFDYVKSSGFDNTGVDSISDLPYSLWLVSEMTKNNGMTGVHETDDVTEYSYTNGLYDSTDREYRGFEVIDTIEPNGSKKKYVFKQDDILKGRLEEEQHRNSSNDPFLETENTWSSASSSGVITVSLNSEKFYTYDEEASDPKIIQYDYTYDSYGNITKKSEKGDTSTNVDDRFIYFEYEPNTTDWIVDAVSHTYLNKADDSTKVSETWLYYDDNAFWESYPTIGNLTKEEKWLSGGNIITEYDYDDYGNQISVTDDNEETTTTTFNPSTHTFPITVTNAKDHTTSYTYDVGTGNILTKTDPNGFVTTYEYDVFGRIEKEIKPYENSTYPTVQYTYLEDGNAPEGLLISRRETSSNSATLDNYSFMDGLGREVQSQSEAEDTTKHIVKNTFYDPTGEIKKQTVPYLASITTPTPTPPPTPDYSLNDKTSNANNLTNSGTTEWNSDSPFADSAKSSRAISSSNQYLYAADSASLSFTGSMTAEAWVKFDSLPATGQEMFIASKYRDDNNQTSWTFAIQNNSGTYRFRALTTTNGSNYEAVTVNWTPSTGTWYHVAMVYDSTAPSVKFYVDGAQQGSTQSKSHSSIFDSTTALQIGTINHGGSPSQHLNGKIDEFRIWNVARTQPQIDDNKDLELEGDETGLVAYYPFEDLDEPPVVDSEYPIYVTPDSGAKFTEFNYDPVGRVSEIENPDGSTKTMLYDHWKKTTLDERANIKREFNNAFGKIIKVEEVEDGNTYTTNYEYDSRDFLTEITDEEDNETTFVYDSLGRKTSQTDSDMGTWTFEYDGVGNLISQTDNRDITIEKDYDEINRITLIDYPTDTDISYTYDENSKKGTLTTVVDQAGTVNFSYDNRLRKTQEERTISGTTKTTSFTYDAMGRLKSQTNPDSEVINFTFNNQGEIDSATGSAQLIDAIDYNALGKITKKEYGNGLSTNYTYDTDDFRLSRIQTGSLQDLNYTYDYVGNITSITDEVLDTTKLFGYDDLDRLTTASQSGSFNYQYDYSPIGNLTIFTSSGSARVYTYGENNKPHALTSIATPSATFTYDENGNMTSDGTYCYEFNEANQLEVVTDCDSDDTISEYIYDYNGNRMVKRNFVSDTLHNTVYSWSDSYQTEVIVGGSAENTSYYFVNSELIAKKNPNSTINFIHSDHLGSTTVISSSSGALVEATTYDPWGDIQSGGTASKFLYTGQEHDLETGLHYYNARYYNPEIRRFTQPDDIIQDAYDPQSLNRYSYVRNNPIRYTDPTGHFIGSIFDTLKSLYTYFAGSNKQEAKPKTQAVARQNSSNSKEKSSNDNLGGFAAIGAGIAENQAKGSSLEQASQFYENLSKNNENLKLYGNRRPDLLSHTNKFIGECKAVSYQCLTPQLKQFMSYADDMGYQFRLYVRDNTRLSGPLQDAVNYLPAAEVIRLTPIAPTTFTPPIPILLNPNLIFPYNSYDKQDMQKL